MELNSEGGGSDTTLNSSKGMVFSSSEFQFRIKYLCLRSTDKFEL